MRIRPRRRHAPPRSLCLLLLALGSCAPPEQSVRPGVNDEYRTTPLETWVERFEGESRELFVHRRRLVDQLGLRPGDVVADIGAGTGAFTLVLAEKVGPAGKVFAEDIFPMFAERIREKSEQAGLRNVVTVLGSEKSVELPPGSIDLAFLCDVYHHFEYPRTMLASIRRALRPGGRLVIVDFERIEGKSRQWILDHVRAGRQTVIAEVRAAGFRPARTPDTPYLKENYVLIFERP